MRIGIDARSIGNKVCGVSRVAKCLIEALGKYDTEYEYIVYLDSMEELDVGSNFSLKPTNCSRKNPVHDAKLYSIIKKDDLDLYHAFHSWLPEFLSLQIKKVVTIHDLFSVTDPHFFDKYKPFHGFAKLYFKYLTDRSIRAAAAVVTVSNYCKGELIKHFHVLDEKIHVIYNARGIPDHPSSKAAGNKWQSINGKYLLYVGNCRSYKNTDVLIKGFHHFINRNKKSEINLIITGNDIYDVLKDQVRELGIAARVSFLTNLQDNEIRDLYIQALAFIMPSKYEGFGIPVLEAMSFGAPVIISDADALVEVAGGAALVFQKNKPEDLASAIEKIVSDNELRHKLIESGFNRSKDFTWESSAHKLAELYHKILNKKEISGT